MLNGQKIIILGDFSVGERLTHSVSRCNLFLLVRANQEQLSVLMALKIREQ